MMLGARIVAPQGFKCFDQGQAYHFLNSDSDRNRVRLVLFANENEDVSVELITVSRIDFEEGLEQGFLVEDARDDYPPWLGPIQGYSVSHLERRRISTKESYSQKVDRRYMAISELIANYLIVISSDNPNAIINAHAKKSIPQQNARRLRLWFYSYIVFGFNKWALMPPLHRIGGWNREAHTNSRKLGRPSPKGRSSGYPCTAEMKEKILSGFLRFRSAYGSQERLYSDVLTKEFGCTVVTRGDSKSFIHPDGKPFPSITQFKYWVRKLINPKALAYELKGPHIARAQAGSEGSFAESLTNLNQRVEFDGYNLSEKLSGITEGSAVDGFCVVRAVCGLSGAILGIGFSEGRDTMEANRMALFSMAIDKVKFGELFGLVIKPGEWPSIGLSGSIVFDRGPGAGYDCTSEIRWLGSLELTPSFSGQSKATVESSHPRDKKTLDQPSYVHSKLNFVQMARREIMRVLSDNHSSDAAMRMTEEMLLTGFKPTPHNIWCYLDSRGRNSAIGMPYDRAVRLFLTEHPATIKKDAVYFYGRKYRSQALVNTRVFDRIARNGTVSVSAFALTMCVRHIWVEVEGLLYELDFIRPASTPESSVDISLHDLKEIDKMRRAVAADLRHERPAIQQEFRDRFERETGEEWDSGQRKLGRPSKGGAALRDTADFNRLRGKAK